MIMEHIKDIWPKILWHKKSRQWGNRLANTGREEHQKSNFFLKLDMELFQSKLNLVE